MLLFLIDFAFAEARQRQWQHFVDNTQATPWTESMPIQRGNLVLSGASWQPFSPFPLDEVATSPCGSWRHDTSTLKRAHPLLCHTYKGFNHVAFDSDVKIPRVLEGEPLAQPSDPFNPRELWMSYTPQEVFTLRPGLRKAKGRTVVVGLGMGWQLTRVLQKKSVEEVTLVERSQNLVDWVLPALQKNHDAPWEKLKQIVVGDAYEEVPRLQADVALWDIWERLGQVDLADEEAMSLKCPNVKQTWFWGAHGWKQR